MSDNPYAPPAADLKDIARHGTSPALWNPNAAANWSLLFSPAFGAFVQMKNWQALGEPAKAAASRVWAVVSLVVIAGVSCFDAFVHDSKMLHNLTRAVAITLLLSWYFSTGRPQVQCVKARFGTTYQRKSWGTPLLLAFAAIFGLFIAGFVCAIVGTALAPD